MFSLATPSATIAILKKYNLSLRKKLGQNFLVDENILKKIISSANLNPDEIVLEVGPGIGTLTRALAGKAKTLVAVEIDKTFCLVLEETLSDLDNVKLICADALKFDLSALSSAPQSLKLVSNLPYNIATSLLITYLKKYPQIKEYIVMVQKEVAERIVALPESKEYGAFSLKIQYFARPKILFTVSKNVFLPKPKVDSAVVRIVRLDKPEVTVEDAQFLFKVIEAAFSVRRKIIKNALISAFASKEIIAESLRNSRIDEIRRGESLSLKDFAKLSNELLKQGISS
ncbi:MAG: 16S rRNA (adenine(1518)-N(6)/adenine(1519)-N(6))-dimethyltransferase RsmA [Candidatus Subteraquimicrobiales bacterium]|nr:16S rRNA (adenine(1518)-N(6)/adenine(1519)-N(6))-dimethyltransferase RsmA [Candidatus Subteraquimicrobiales bacterium]